jgi:hypothetical protein
MIMLQGKKSFNWTTKERDSIHLIIFILAKYGVSLRNNKYAWRL